jgi:hypothetical protein
MPGLVFLPAIHHFSSKTLPSTCWQKKHEGLTMLVDEGAVNEWDESLATVFDTMRKRRLILLTVCPQEKGPGPATFNCRNTL